jgi:hypothetical protein
VASVQSTDDSRGVRISGSNAGYTMFRGSVKSTGYPLYLPVSPSLPLPCVTVCRHISTGLYHHYGLYHCLSFIGANQALISSIGMLTSGCVQCFMLFAHLFLQPQIVLLKEPTVFQLQNISQVSVL